MSVELDGANNTVKTDTISEVTSANGVTIDGLSIKDGKLVTADSVIEANMSANSVDSDSYVDGSIDNAHIADDAIDSEHYAAGSIDTAHIADNQITLAKMAGGTDGNLITYDASGDPAYVVTGSDGQILTSAGAGAAPTFETLSSGKVLQVQSYGNAIAENTTSTSYQTTGILDAITPSATSSTVLVICSVTYSMYASSHLAYPRFALFRDSTEISHRKVSGRADSVGNFQFGDNIVFTILDSPSSTSAITYTVKMRNNSSYGGTIYINDDGDSSITLMEIGA